MKFGLLGRKLGHSYSPQIFHLMGGYTYLIHEREPDGIAELLRNEPFDGLNVTIPYKKDVFAHLDQVDPLAQRLKSVNTVVKRDGKLYGHNSDYYGFSSLVARSGLDVTGKKVLVLGSGGASVTVQAVLEDLGANVVTVSRTGENNYENLDRHPDTAVIVNTTPVGMYPNTGTAPLDVERFHCLEGVFDLIYNPARTQLLLDCEYLGIPAWNGLWMLVAQAKKSAEWFMDKPLDDGLIASVHRQLRDQMQNIALIGMAGCGKTTVGRLLAEKTGKQFVDADEEIVKLAAKSIPEIFAQDGEDAFREYETRVLAELGKKSGLVIATGGGCVTKDRNYPLLHQNSRIIWLKRNTALLPTEGRPLSQKTDPAVLYMQRKPLYAAFADAAVKNDSTPENCAERIIDVLEEI